MICYMIMCMLKSSKKIFDLFISKSHEDMAARKKTFAGDHDF